MHRSIVLFTAVAAVALNFAGCETSGQNALLGAGAGAAIAAVAGECTVHGAAIGAGAGFLIGKVIQNEREREYERGYYDAQVHPGYLVAERSRPGFVISPYKPHYEIDVRGFPHGARVLDPSNDRVFINP